MEEMYIIGEIDFTECEEIDYFSIEILGENQVGNVNLPKLGSCKVCVYTNEGDYIAHCHILSNGNPDICVRLDKAELFKHGKNIGEFENTKQKKLFDKFMKSNWEKCADVWNSAKGNINKIDTNKMSKPDYTTL